MVWERGGEKARENIALSEESSETPEPEKEAGKRKALRWEIGQYGDLIQTPCSNGRVYIARRLANSKSRCLLRF